MKTFVEFSGYSVIEAISCCTKTGSEIMGFGDRIGTLKKSDIAEIMVVDGNLLEDM